MMNYNFISSKLNNWHHTKFKDNVVWYTGLTSNEINIYIELIINTIDNNNNLSNVLKKIDNNFSILIFNKIFTFAAVDHARTYPIYYSFHDKKYYFSPQADEINKNIKGIIDNEQRLAFQMSGYTISSNTLWKNIKSLNAGTFAIFKQSETPNITPYFIYSPWEETNINRDYKTELKIEIKNLIKKLIKKANGNTIIIPLSAGLDSRLVVSGLKHYGYDNVKCFSYGKKNNFEAKAAKKIANKLNYEWYFCEINKKGIKKFYQSNTFKDFIIKTNDGAATQGIQDVYAISKLKKINYIKCNDIIVNGNSGDFISGGHIPLELLENNNFSLNDILNIHIKKHYSLWGTLSSKENIDVIKKMLLQQINELNFLKENKNYYAILEYIEFHNRQCKYVNNLQRTYDYYDQKWKLPLWDIEFMQFWSTVPLHLKLKQKLYKEVLKELNFYGVWEDEYNIKFKNSSFYLNILRNIFKALHIFANKKTWHKFDRKYISYWTDNLYGYSIYKYKDVILNKNDARSSVSWLTLNSEKLNFNKHWQE